MRCVSCVMSENSLVCVKSSHCAAAKHTVQNKHVSRQWSIKLFIVTHCSTEKHEQMLSFRAGLCDVYIDFRHIKWRLCVSIGGAVDEAMFKGLT